MTLGNDEFVVSAWGATFPLMCPQKISPRLPPSPPQRPPPPPLPRPCKRIAGAAANADHVMVCEQVAKMTLLRTDNLANASRLVVSAYIC